MARNRVLYIIAVLGCLAFSMLYKENTSALLLVSVLLYPLLSLGVAYLSLIFIKADFIEHDMLNEKGTRFEISVDVKNGFILPCVPLELVCDLPDEDTGLVIEKKIFVTLSPFGKAKLTMNCMNRYRGKYRFRIKKILIFDPLRIIHAGKKADCSLNAVFVPRRLNLPDIFSVLGSENSSAKKRSANDNKEDFSHVRDYFPGENVQLIHWKLTAKQDDIMIKQFDSASDRKALILCDFGSASEEHDALLCVDTMIETAAAFAKALLDEKINTFVELDEGDCDALKISNVSEFESFFEIMSVISPKTKGALALQLDKAAGGESVLVIITAALTEEIILHANQLASEETVFVAYINFSGKPLEIDRDNERFALLNIRGAGQDHLSASVNEITLN